MIPVLDSYKPYPDNEKNNGIYRNTLFLVKVRGIIRSWYGLKRLGMH